MADPGRYIELDYSAPTPAVEPVATLGGFDLPGAQQQQAEAEQEGDGSSKDKKKKKKKKARSCMC